MKKGLLFLISAIASYLGVAQPGYTSGTSTVVGAGPDIYINEGLTGRLNAMGGTSYTWTPSTGLSDSTDCCPFVTVNDTTIYIVKINLGDTAIVYDTVTVFILAPYTTLTTCSNFVTNGDFETYSLPCNGTYNFGPFGQPPGYPFTMPANWVVPNFSATVDYFNTCSAPPPNGGHKSVNVPQGFPGFQWAHSGGGMGGFIPNQRSYTLTLDYSEYYETKFGCTLLSGQNYKVQFWVASGINQGYNCSDIGAYLSNTQLTSPTYGAITSVTPQLTSGSIVVGANTATSTVGTTTVANNTPGSWASITGVVTGSGQNWITIGCFNSNPTNVLFNAGGDAWPYYYLDDVSITPLPPVITTTATTACSGTQFQLCATGGANYTWYGSGGSIGTGTCVTVTAPTVTATSTFNYTVTTTLTCPTTCSYSSVTTVTVYPSPVITVNSASICPSGSTTLTANNGVTYTWSPGTGLSSTNGSTVTASPSSTTIYTVSGTNSNGCIGAATSTVTLYSTPTLTVNTPTICAGSTATMTVSGASTYTWSANAGGVHTSTVAVTPTVTTTYTVSGTSAQGCVGTKTVQVIVNPKPTLSPSATPSVMCASTSTNTTALNVSGASTYTWTAPGSSTISCTPCTSPTATLSGYSTFTFTVTGTSTLSCTNTATVSVTVNQIPTVSVNSPTICKGSSTTLTASGASTYSWSPATGLSGTTGTSVTANPTVTTTYTIAGTTTAGCTATTTSTVTVIPTPTVTVNSATICAGSSTTLTANGASTYTWSPATGLSSTTGSTVTASPTTTTVYTITGTGANTCTSTATSTVTVNPKPTITVNTLTYCAGGSGTFTASGASTYTWSPATGLSSTTGATVTASPTVSTNYTVTGTSAAGCVNTATTSVTVNPYPSISASASPTVICQGSSSTLTGSGGTTYTWAPSGSLSSSTGTTVTATPTVTTTYTVNGTALGCTASNTVALTVTPAPAINVSSVTSSACNYTSPSNTTICAGGSATLTATGVTNYTWNPGGATTSTVVVSPTVTTTYTVTGNSGSCNGTKTITIAVSNCNCTGTALPVLTNTTITGGSYVLNSAVSVSGTVTLNGTTISTGSGSSITVPSGATLNLQGAHLSSCYNNMWQGIVVAQGGVINVTNYTLIEDALVAIDNNPSNTVQTGVPALINVNGAVFNCNKTSIHQGYFQDPSTTSTYYARNYFSVNDAVFTCRCGLPFPITMSSLTTYTNSVPTVTASLSAPDLSDYYSVGNYTAANLKVPANGPAAQEGVKFEMGGAASVQTSSLVPYVYNVGNTRLVLFDNHVYGINASNTSFSVTNTAYQFPRYNPSGFLQQLIIGGYGINAVNDQTDRYNGIYVSSSRFIDMVRAINSSNYFSHVLNGNTLWSQQTIVPYGSSTPISPPHGSYGFNASSARFIDCEMSNNKVANINNVFIFDINNTAGYYNAGNGEFIGNVKVTTNTVTAVFPGNTYSNKYVGTGIAIANSLTPVPGTTVTAGGTIGTPISVTSNTITGAYNGILLSNHQFNEVRDELNVIGMQYYPTLSTETTQYGIQHNNNIYQYSGSGFGEDLYKNTITGITGGTVQATFEKKKGIWSRYNSNHYITCNTVSGAGRAFEFEGGHTSIFWQQNVMTSNAESFALTNSGAIGQQPASGSTASDNQWTNAASFADTYTDASSLPAGSKLYVRSPGTTYPYDPQIHVTLGTAYGYGPTLILNSSASTYSCSQAPPTRHSNPKNSSGHGDVTYRATSSKSNALLELEQIVQDSIAYPAYYAQNSFINKYNVYKLLKFEQRLLDSSDILATFYNSNSNSSWALFCAAEDSLLKGNYGYVKGLAAGFTPANDIEQNYKRFYEICSHTGLHTATAADSTDLAALASSCPMLNGMVVFEARAFRNAWLDIFENYEDNCPTEAQRQSENGLAKANIKGNRTLLVYPNPTNGKIYISGFAVSDRMNSIIVTDITGKIVAKQMSASVNGVIELSLNLNNGVYFIRVSSETGVEKIEKIIINK